MYGPNPAPPSPSEGTRMTLRVVFAVASFLTCGLLACLPLFRIATTRGRWYDWTTAWLSLPMSIGAFAVIGALPETDHRTDVALAFLLLLGAGSAVYFVIFDIRDLQRQRSASTGYFASQPGYSGRTQPGYVAQTQPQAGYGYPPQAPTPVPRAQAAHPYPRGVTPQPPQAPPVPPQHPLSAPQSPHRIDQVRAELDELSDLLRKDTEGRKDEGR